MKKRIDEITLMKGLGIISVMVIHMMGITGISGAVSGVGSIINSLSAPLMMMFYILSGYTLSVKNESVVTALGKRIKVILLPYYKFSIVMIVIDAILFLGIEKKSLNWFADGLAGILLQFQSFHWFDKSIEGVHPMFYGVLAGWYLFQYVVALIIFIPLLYKIYNKNKSYRLVCAIILLSLGAVLYKMNLQGLNGEFFPPVCKIIILPNIPAIAGLLMVGNYMSSLSVFDFEKYSTVKKIACAIISLLCIIVMCIYDDHLYDFPIGKWGSYGALGYYTETIFGVAFVLFLAIICSQIKKCTVLKRALVFCGNNSMDFLIMHLYVGFLVARMSGYWFYYLNESNPNSDICVMGINTVILIIVVVAICSIKVIVSKRIGDIYHNCK